MENVNAIEEKKEEVLEEVLEDLEAEDAKKQEEAHNCTVYSS